MNPLYGSLCVLAFLGSCAGRAPAVNKAADQKRLAYMAYAEGNEQILDAILEANKKEAFAHIETVIQRDIDKVRYNAQAVGGKVDVEQAIAFVNKLVSERDAAKEKVESNVRQIREIMARNRVNLAIAMKLDEAIEQYELAGFDMSAAKNASAEIMALVSKVGKGGGK